MNPQAIKEVGKKKGDFLDRFTRLQRIAMPFSKRTVRKKRVERFKTLEDLNNGRAN
jgi:hypothetical protein